jgi:hypothetical protein
MPGVGGHWELLMDIGAFLLGLVLAWAMWRNHHRNKANDKVTEEATRELYADPDHYDKEREEEFRRQVRPS